MSPKDAISVIESLESKFQALKWHARCQQAKLTTPDNTKNYEVIEPIDMRSEIIFDPIGERYLIKINSVNKWVQGADPFVSTVEAHSFDGEVYRQLDWEKPGKILPTPNDTRGNGVICNDKGNLSPWGNDIVKKQSFALGTAYMPPYFSSISADYPTQRLSRLIRTWLDEGKEVTILESNTKVWTINAKPFKLGPYDHLLTITYDLTKGGVVTGVRLLAPDEKGEYLCENVRVEIELQQVNGHFWFPKVIKQVWPNDNSMTFTSIENIEVNPPITAETFRVEFPKGVYITDYINKMHYVEGNAIGRVKWEG